MKCHPNLCRTDGWERFREVQMRGSQRGGLSKHGKCQGPVYSSQCFFICFRETKIFLLQKNSRPSGAIFAENDRFWMKIVIESFILPAAGDFFGGFCTSTMDFPLIFDEFSGNFFKISENIFVTTKNIFAQTKQSENCFVSNEKNTGV